MELKTNSVRGAARSFLERYSHVLASPILEVGSRCTCPFADRPWINNRTLRPDCKFVGVDMQAGEGVDIVADFCRPNVDVGDFESAILSEVLEHVVDPDVFMENVNAHLPVGGHVLITVPFAFYEHGFPDDYRRWTRSGMQTFLEQHGFEMIHNDVLSWVTPVPMISDHGEEARPFPTAQSFGFVARKAA